MCLSDEAGTRRCRNLISEREMITAAGGCTHSSWNTLDSLSKGYVTTRAPPFGEKREETKGEREEEQSVESRMPQNATKARKILYGPGGTDWTGPMARAERHCNAKYVRGSKNASTSYTYKRAQCA